MRRREKSIRTEEYDAVLDTSVGRVGIVMQDGALVDVSFLGRSAPLRSPRTVPAQKICR